MSVEMYAQHQDAATLPHTGARGNCEYAVRAVDEIDGAVCTLQCLSSGYLSGGQRCECAIPEAVVGEAWRRELERGWTQGEAFFRVMWQNQQWLGYGRPDGTVRGVYCPTHAAERDQRAFMSITGGEAHAPAARSRA